MGVFAFMLIKTYHASGIRCFNHDSMLFERIEDKIKQLYKLNCPVKLFYKDDEGDWVNLTCDDDVSFAAATCNSPKLRIKVTTQKSSSESFMCNPCNREEICKLSKAIMESQGFENLVQQMLPKVIAAIQETNEAPKLQPNHHLIIKKEDPAPASSPFSSESSFIMEPNRGNQDTKQVVKQFRERMANLGLVNTNPQVDAAVTKSTESEDDFVLIDNPLSESGQSRTRKSICDVLVELGFNDLKRNNELIQKYEGDIERVLDALLTS